MIYVLLGGVLYLNYFPKSNEEKELIKFIAQYQYLYVSDAKYFFSSTMYYKKRIHSLIENNFLKKIKLNLVLGELGIEYAKLFNFDYNKLNRNAKYLPRLLYISSLAAFYHNSNTSSYTPSFSIKNKEEFTSTARRYIGILEINHISYLAYHIPKNSTKQYILSVIYDIQKEKQYKNIIILADDLSMINASEFVFGMHQVLLIEDTLVNREKLQYLNNVNWSNVIQKLYKSKVHLAEYSFCDYTDYKDKYVSFFYTLDTEKVNRIRYFLLENKNKNMTIVCNKELQTTLNKELPTCNYDIIALEDYIEKEHYIYD